MDEPNHGEIRKMHHQHPETATVMAIESLIAAEVGEKKNVTIKEIKSVITEEIEGRGGREAQVEMIEEIDDGIGTEMTDRSVSLSGWMSPQIIRVNLTLKKTSKSGRIR